ncbi:MAG: SDR family NAD(P)-dependent oxidoreductase [Desulfomonilia bacterium]
MLERASVPSWRREHLNGEVDSLLEMDVGVLNERTNENGKEEKIMDLKGKTAVITGAGQGIGRAIAITLSAKGADAALVDINSDRAQAVAREIHQTGARAEMFITDVTRYDQVSSTVSGIQESFGRIDILVNNVGWDDTKPFIETTPDLWQKIVEINLISAFNVTHAVLPHMISRNTGRIINISSDAGRMGAIYAAAYSSSKAGIIGFTKTIAREMAPHNILVNCITPGAIDTPLWNEITKDEAGASMLRKTLRSIPLKRMGDPVEVASVVAFFASDEASYITGQVLSVDGGMLMSD